MNYEKLREIIAKNQLFNEDISNVFLLAIDSMIDRMNICITCNQAYNDQTGAYLEIAVNKKTACVNTCSTNCLMSFLNKHYHEFKILFNYFDERKEARRIRKVIKESIVAEEIRNLLKSALSNFSFSKSYVCSTCNENFFTTINNSCYIEFYSIDKIPRKVIQTHFCSMKCVKEYIAEHPIERKGIVKTTQEDDEWTNTDYER